MDARQLTPTLAVSGQIDPQDLTALAESGFRVIIDNRPDDEIPPSHHADRMKAEAERLNMSFHYIPLSPGGLSGEILAQMSAALNQTGPILAYCRSGQRSTLLWALTQAGQRPTEDILRMAALAGYDISGMAPMIDHFAQS